MSTYVPVTETEPGRLDTVGLEFGFRVESFLSTTPTAIRVDAVAKGVHHGVQIRAYAQAVDPNVVSGVTDDGDGGVGRCSGLVDVVSKPAQEPSAADTSG